MYVPERKVLLNPGPATTTNTVKYSQIVSDICPREEEFGDLLEEISQDLTKIVANTVEYSTILFGGSGTAAVESMISSLSDDDKLLIVNNGAYGKQMSDIAKTYELDHIDFLSGPDQPLQIGSLERTINGSKKKVTHLAIVHNETSTGLLNNLESIGRLCKKYDLYLLVDAMSSFGAIPIDMEKWSISLLAASSNKNVQGMPGVAFVVANKKIVEAMKNVKPRNYYLNLFKHYDYLKKHHQMPFTPPVQTMYAFKQAINELFTEGVENRYQRYTSLWDMLMTGLLQLNLTHLVSRENHSKIVTAIIEPVSQQYDFKDMHDFFYEKNITIYPGKTEVANTFRVANIGDINKKDIELFLDVLKEYLIKIKYIT